MNYAYLALLRLYPAGYRDRFGSEMADVFAEARRDEWRQGWVCYARFLIQEFAGLIRGAFRAWLIAAGRQPYVMRHGSLAASIAAGMIVTIALHGTMYRGAHRSLHVPPDSTWPEADKFALLVMVSICCLLMAVLLVALFWMIERSKHAWQGARTARRHENLHGHSRGAGRQLRRARR